MYYYSAPCAQKEAYIMAVLFSISVALMAGLLMSRLIKPLKLPAVTAYLVAGILIGPYVLGAAGIEGLGFPTMEYLKSFEIMSQVALGFIAFAIGNEFRLSQLRATGKAATVVAIVQAITATLFVDVALIALHFIMPDKLSISAALVLGAIATATAPAATLMVVRQYKAKGPVTSMLLPVVALDDAIGLFGVARALSSGAFSLISVLVEPLVEVVASLLLGSVMGILLTLVERCFKSNSKRLSITITFVLFTVALSMLKFHIGPVHVGFSSLLVCMMLGTVFCNLCDFSAELMEKADKWTAPLFVLFFVLSGAELELSVFSEIAIIGIGLVYILFRSAGKILGATAGSKMMKCDENITKYLGITLLPQAGVALGMSLTATQTMGAEGALVRNIVLFSVLIYELVGPMLTKIALTRAGDITPKADAGLVVSTEEDDEE